MVCDIILFSFVVSQHPRLKKRYQRHAEKVKEYLESVKDFDELVFSSIFISSFFGSRVY